MHEERDGLEKERSFCMNHSLTEGSLKKALILFAIPLFFSQLFQTLYNTADTVIIGHYLGDASLAAVGSVASLFELIVGFCTGFGQGLGVIAAQKFGARDEAGYRKAAALSVLFSLILSLMLSAAMSLLLPSILRFMKTPSDIYPDAYGYISVIASGLVITMFYNLMAGLLRAAGDSKTPLYVLMVSSIINVILDILFITVNKMGVAGTAWATLIAQGISLALCVLWVFWKKRELIPGIRDFSWNKNLAASLVQMGFSMALMSSIVSLGTLILQTGINPLGMEIISGHTAARKLMSILNQPVSALMLALSSYTAQNTGASQYLRVEKGIAFANRLGLYYSTILTCIILVFSRELIALISGTQSESVLATGSLYLRTNVPFFPVLAVLLNLRTSLQSMSMKIIPVGSSIIELIGKILFTRLIVPFTGYYGICACEPCLWLTMASFLAFFYLRASIFKQKGIKAHLYA